MLHVFLIILTLFAMIFYLDRRDRMKRLARGTLWKLLEDEVVITRLTGQYVHFYSGRTHAFYEWPIATFEEKAVSLDIA